MTKGQILSESQFYIVEEVLSNGNVVVKDDNSTKIELSKEYAEKLLSSAHTFNKEEKKTKTELAEIFIANSRIAMTVCFYKQVKESDVVAEMISAISGAKIAEIEKAIRTGVKKAITGEQRIMIGNHYGATDEFGRIHFVDREVIRDTNKSYDNRMRLVDPRTIQWIIVNNTKYTIK